MHPFSREKWGTASPVALSYSIHLYIVYCCLFVSLPCVVLFGLMATRLNKHYYYYYYYTYIEALFMGYEGYACPAIGVGSSPTFL